MENQKNQANHISDKMADGQIAIQIQQPAGDVLVFFFEENVGTKVRADAGEGFVKCVQRFVFWLHGLKKSVALIF